MTAHLVAGEPFLGLECIALRCARGPRLCCRDVERGHSAEIERASRSDPRWCFVDDPRVAGGPLERGEPRRLRAFGCAHSRSDDGARPLAALRRLDR